MKEQEYHSNREGLQCDHSECELGGHGYGHVHHGMVWGEAEAGPGELEGKQQVGQTRREVVEAKY